MRGTPSAAQAIVVGDLRKSYGSTTAVDGVSFDVATGEFFGILGPNGAGKTTTLEIIEGLRSPDSGTVTVLGHTPLRRDADFLRRIGVQMQTSSFFERLTAREQIHTFAALYGVSRASADSTLEALGLADKAGTRVEHLSGGQAQRLSIACALVHGPELLFLDEPTAGLDPQARRNLWDVLRGINAGGCTVVLTTHYLDEAEILCDRVSIMDGGRILNCGAPATLIKEHDAPTRIAVPADGLTPDEAQRLFPQATVTAVEDEVVIATREPAETLATLVRHGAMRGLSVRSATLEDVFLSLTGREYRA